jgi:A/G-specific adenine glycosylase
MTPRSQIAKSKKINVLRRKILGWFKTAGRDLPWRKTNDPYAIVVSEIMLQQTQVDRVIPKYLAFLEKFPSWEALARASQADVVKMWHGLGYNRRALGLHRLAKAVVELGSLPSDPEAMRELPGIGPYTSQAVAAFAFRRKKAAPVDTNIERIIRRVFRSRISRSASSWIDLNKHEVAALARELVPADVWSWNHALMDFGATICVARSPKCDICPLKDICAAYPCDGNDIVKAKQTTFKDSDRFYRGQLISFLRQHNVLRRNQVGTKIGLQNIDRTNKIINSLIKDQLITEQDGKLLLAE